MSDVVTVAVPVLNGARYLDEVLTAVRSQRVDREVEILVVDSGSTDGSAEIARKHDARVHEIPKSEFSHGGTRNLMMELARGDYVAFLTQDATPAHDRWLAALLEGFEQADDVAAVWGPHDARQTASHVIKAEMERHFAIWGGGREIDVQRLDRSPTGLAAYRAEPWRLTFFSSVNCCLSKEAWQRVPFRDVPYAEDQLIARELIEAGYAKVFNPEARVLHSHEFRPLRFFRRYFDEFRGLREVLGLPRAGRAPAHGSILAVADGGGSEVAAEARRSRAAPDMEAAPVPPCTMRSDCSARSSARARIDCRRGSAGCSRWKAARRSFRRTFRPVACSYSPDNVAIDADWGWEFVRLARDEPVRADEHAPRSCRPDDAGLGDPALARRFRRPCGDLPADPRAGEARPQLRGLHLRSLPLRAPSGVGAQG